MGDDIKKWKKIWNDQKASLTEEEQKIGDAVADAGHPAAIYAKWKAGPKDEPKKKKLLATLGDIEKAYTPYGGLAGWHKRIKKAMKDAISEKHNHFSGYHASPPEGKIFTDSKEDLAAIDELEVKGLAAVASCAFVLCAGGAGQRLGLKNLSKMACCADVLRDEPILKHYIDYILAFQSQAARNATLPLVIMTSEDTHDEIKEMLSSNDNFGMHASQITLLKQAKLFAVHNDACNPTIAGKDPYGVDWHHHGPGAVHSLIRAAGLVDGWLKKNIKHIVFFQDNNLLGLNGVLTALGVTNDEKYAVNYVCVPRNPLEDKQRHHQDILATWTKKKSDPPEMKTEVIPSPIGDDIWKLNKIKEVKHESGESQYPAITHTMIVDAKLYEGFLAEHNGLVHEFVFANWKDRKKGIPKGGTGLETRLEGMVFPANTPVGFTAMPAWMVYAPFTNGFDEVKHAIKDKLPQNSLCSAEHALFYWSRRIMEQAGVDIAVDGKDLNFGGFGAPNGAATNVILGPAFGPTLARMRSKLQSSNDLKVTVTAKSMLVLDGEGIQVAGLTLEGCLMIKAVRGANVIIDNLTVKNKGWDLSKISEKHRKKFHGGTKFLVRGYHLNRDLIDPKSGQKRALLCQYDAKGVFDLFHESQVPSIIIDPEEERLREEEAAAAAQGNATPGSQSAASTRPSSSAGKTPSRTPRKS